MRANWGRPLVSVLTPSFNQARWLGDNLHSVAAQSYPNVEHIVMDGGSTDGSREILERAGPAVRWRSEPDLGQSHAINKAFAESRGEIIGWLNSDDAYYDAKVIARVVRFFETHPEIDVAYGHAMLANAEGLILQCIWVPPFHRGLLRQHNFIIQPAAFLRRSAVERWLVDESYDSAMDRELWLRLAPSSRFGRVTAILAIDRHHEARKSLVRTDLASRDTSRLREVYGVPDGTFAHRVRLKALKVAFRLTGLSLIGRAGAPLAFDGRLDSRRSLAYRQVAVRRRKMPRDA